jgi:hypothetical protein
VFIVASLPVTGMILYTGKKKITPRARPSPGLKKQPNQSGSGSLIAGF